MERPDGMRHSTGKAKPTGLASLPAAARGSAVAPAAAHAGRRHPRSAPVRRCAIERRTDAAKACCGGSGERPLVRGIAPAGRSALRSRRSVFPGTFRGSRSRTQPRAGCGVPNPGELQCLLPCAPQLPTPGPANSTRRCRAGAGRRSGGGVASNPQPTGSPRCRPQAKSVLVHRGQPTHRERSERPAAVGAPMLGVRCDDHRGRQRRGVDAALSARRSQCLWSPGPAPPGR